MLFRFWKEYYYHLFSSFSFFRNFVMVEEEDHSIDLNRKMMKVDENKLLKQSNEKHKFVFHRLIELNDGRKYALKTGTVVILRFFFLSMVFLLSSFFC